MLRHIRYAAVIAAASLAIAGAARADTIKGSATFADTTNSNDLIVADAFNGTGHNGDHFTLNNVAVGGSATTFSDFLTLDTFITTDGSQKQTDAISVTFSITQPGSGDGSLGGGVTETQTAQGWYNTFSASVTWNNPLTIALSNGDDLIVNLENTTLSSSDCDFYDACGSVDASFALTDPTPAPVPEPATLALLGGGLLGLGFVARRTHG